MSHGSATSFTVASRGSWRTAVRKRMVRVESLRPAAERAGKIEAEAVDVADLDPITQRIHHHLQHAGVRQVQRVAGAGVVLVVARVVGHEPVVGGVVDAAKRQRRAEMVALGGVIVDDIEYHLEAGVVQPRDRGAKLVDRAVLRIALLRREERERVVAPVIDAACARRDSGRR